MNEAEISRIVGGRSNWEGIKAAVNKWQTDPSKALSITPEQRKEIQALMTARQGRLQQEQSILDDAGDQLTSATSVAQHRQIYNNAQKRLSAAMGGGASNNTGGNTGTVTMRAPNGQTKEVPADQVDHYKQLGAVVVNP